MKVKKILTFFIVINILIINCFSITINDYQYLNDNDYNNFLNNKNISLRNLINQTSTNAIHNKTKITLFFYLYPYPYYLTLNADQLVNNYYNDYYGVYSPGTIGTITIYLLNILDDYNVNITNNLNNYSINQTILNQILITYIHEIGHLLVYKHSLLNNSNITENYLVNDFLNDNIILHDIRTNLTNFTNNSIIIDYNNSEIDFIKYIDPNHIKTNYNSSNWVEEWFVRINSICFLLNQYPYNDLKLISIKEYSPTNFCLNVFNVTPYFNYYQNLFFTNYNDITLSNYKVGHISRLPENKPNKILNNYGEIIKSFFNNFKEPLLKFLLLISLTTTIVSLVFVIKETILKHIK